MRWIALFSQTGTEIYEVSEILGRFPDTVICNGQDYEEINNKLMNVGGFIGKMMTM